MRLMTTSNDIPLASHAVDRAAHHRTDTAWLSDALQSDSVLVFFMQDGLPLVTPEGSNLVWLGPEYKRLTPQQETVFMGQDKNQTPIFAVGLGSAFKLEGSLLEDAGSFADMRAAAGQLTPLEANLAATARSLLEWHRSHGFCARCGHPTDTAEAGWKRVCSSCHAEHFPRTDPVAIMLAVKDNKCLLGRQASWPAGFWSCLAGFVEPGETVEQAAARELEEEAGIIANPASASYLFCQPWPFPSSLMMGIILEAETEDISVAQDELEAARWITREEARQVIAGTHPDIYCPPPMAVAHHILKAWALAEVD